MIGKMRFFDRFLPKNFGIWKKLYRFVPQWLKMPRWAISLIGYCKKNTDTKNFSKSYEAHSSIRHQVRRCRSTKRREDEVRINAQHQHIFQPQNCPDSPWCVYSSPTLGSRDREFFDMLATLGEADPSKRETKNNNSVLTGRAITPSH